jgi:hypothetical protein
MTFTSTLLQHTLFVIKIKLVQELYVMAKILTISNVCERFDIV